MLALPSWLIFGNPARLPHTAVQWGVLVWMGLFATALGMFWWVKGSTRVDAGALAVMNELHVPLGLLVNLLIWNRDADLKKIALGGGVILLSLALNRAGRLDYPVFARMIRQVMPDRTMKPGIHWRSPPG